MRSGPTRDLEPLLSSDFLSRLGASQRIREFGAGHAPQVRPIVARFDVPFPDARMKVEVFER